MRATFLAAMTVAAFASLTPAHAATIVPDGNFNAPLSPGNFTTYGDGDTFGPWTVGHGVDLIGSYWQAPPTGGGSVDLAGNVPGFIYQYFNAAAGTQTLNFYLAGNPDGGNPLKHMTAYVLAAGGLYSSALSFDTTGFSKTGMGWALEGLQFNNLGGGLIGIQFSSTDIDTPFGAVIGGISISAVPEPATWAMLLLGFAGIGMILRGRKGVAFLSEQLRA
jgi:hypothetical protein